MTHFHFILNDHKKTAKGGESQPIIPTPLELRRSTRYIDAMSHPIPPESDFVMRLRNNGNSVSIAAPAKINLFLKVLGKRPDGYHDIFSWFQTLDLADRIEIHKTIDRKINLITDHPDLSVGPDNLIYKAAKTIQDNYTPEIGFQIKLEKRIPIGAGLGGGSSDAAAVIKGLNHLLRLGLTVSQMVDLGLEIGSDVPFFFSRGQAEVTGRGERVREISLPVDYQALLVTPPFEIRAAEAYRKFKLDLTVKELDVSFRCRKAHELFDVISELANDLERALLISYPILDKVRDELIKTGANIVRLTGSGPTIFALYGDTAPDAEELTPRFRGERWGVQLARPVILPA